MPRKPSRANLEKWYKDELARKDKQIADLKEENRDLLAAVFREATKTAELDARLRRHLKK